MRALSLPPLVFILGLAACQSPPPEAFVASSGTRAAAETRPVGNNARGETCLAQGGVAPVLDLPVARAEEAFCGGWTQPSARVFTLRGMVDLDRVAAAGAWRNWLDQRLRCEAPQRTTLAGGLDARLLACTRRSNGSTTLALAIAGRDGLVLADGLPASLPVIEGMVAGNAAPGGRVARSEATQLAVSRYAADRQGAADEAQYDRLMLLGRELNQTENFAAAEDAYRQALAARITALRSDNDPNLATPIMHVALNLSNQGRFDEAERLFARAATLAPDAADRTAMARLEQYRAMHSVNRGQLDVAVARLATAEAGYRAIVPSSLLAPATPPSGQSAMTPGGLAEMAEPQVYSAVLGLAEVVRYRAVIASRQGDARRATADLALSQAVLRNAGLAPGILDGRRLRAEGMILARDNQAQAAAGRLSTAATRLSVSLPGERPVATTLFLTGREWLAAGRPTEAVASFRSGAQVLRARRIGLDVEEMLPFIDALEAAAQASPSQATALRAEAFAAAQLARRSETSRFLAQAGARLGAAGGNEAVGNALRRREDLDLELRALLVERDAALAGGLAAGTLDARIAERRALREEAEADVLASAPEYRALRDEAIDATEAGNQLGSREALVQLLLGPDFGYAIVLRHGQPVRLARLAINQAQAARLVTAARAAMDAGPQAGSTLQPFTTGAAAELYDRLLRPVEAMLQGAETLILVPDGPLLGLPFGMLLTGPADTGSLATAPWLIRRHAIVHAPSVQALTTLRGRSPGSAAAQPYLGFGDFVPPTPSQLRRSFPADRCGNDAALAARLERLPGFRREVELVSAALGQGSVQRLGRDFTAGAVQQARLQDFRIVHFATHGLLPGDLSCLTEPAIMVSSLPSAPDAASGFLGASAILRLRMDADLVILSACNTAGTGVAGGSEQSAEALSGLARAFFVAGARGVLASHWLANDLAATVLMTRMLTIQNGGETGGRPVSSAQALQRAQLGLMEANLGGTSLAHPFYWAAFALIGDGKREAVGQTADARGRAGATGG